MRKVLFGGILTAAMILGTGLSRAAVVAFYDFEENTPLGGTLTDGGGGNLLNMIKFGPGTPGTSGPTYSTDTPISGNGHAFGGRSLTFPVPQKAGAYVSPGANTKLERQTFTVEGWVKITSTGDWQTVFSYQPAGAFSARSGFALGVRPEGTAFFRVGVEPAATSWKYATGTTVLARHTWYHLAGVYSAGTMQVFVNGVQEGTQTNVPPISYRDHPELGGGPAPKTAYIGLEHNGDGTGPTSQAELIYFMREGGKVDRVMIHDTALDASKLDYGYNLATVQGTVVLQGYLGDYAIQSINVEFRPLAGGDNITRTADLNADGIFTVGNVVIAPGAYDVAVRGGNWLQTVVPNVTVGAGLTVLPDPIVLKGGDCNGDDRVTFEDFSMLQNSYGQCGDAGLSAAGTLTGNVGGCGPLATALMVLLGLTFRALVWGSEA